MSIMRRSIVWVSVVSQCVKSGTTFGRNEPEVTSRDDIAENNYRVDFFILHFMG